MVGYDFLSFTNKYHNMVAYSRSLCIVSPHIFICSRGRDARLLRDGLDPLVDPLVPIISESNLDHFIL